MWRCFGDGSRVCSVQKLALRPLPWRIDYNLEDELGSKMRQIHDLYAVIAGNAFAYSPY